MSSASDQGTFVRANTPAMVEYARLAEKLDALFDVGEDRAQEVIKLAADLDTAWFAMRQAERCLLSESVQTTENSATHWRCLYENLLTAVDKHRSRRGHDRCWEDDLELYRAAGLEEPEPNPPPIEEHRYECDRYRAGLYQSPSENEPYYQICRLKTLLAETEEAKAKGLFGVLSNLHLKMKEILRDPEDL